MPEGPTTGWRLERVSGDALPSVDLGAEGRWPAWYRALPEWARHWAPPATLAAIAISLVVHLMIWVIAAVVMIGGAQAGGGSGSGDSLPVGMAILTEAELGELMGGAAIDADAPAVAELPTVSVAGGESELHVTDSLVGGTEPGGLGEGLGDLTSGLGAGDIGGLGLGVGGAGGGAASFFGVEARGTRFAYIVDVSGSMDAGIGVAELRRIDSLKHELTKSIEGLLENAAFFIVTFSDSAKAVGGRHEWTSASESGKSQIKKLIANITPDGGTEPYPGFEIVYRMRPRPDAIYFMTDGEFDEGVVLKVARLNAELRIPIHCIAFISTGGEETLKRIAKESGGSYAHVAGPRK